jgi:small conductance mechanosensitive channel
VDLDPANAVVSIQNGWAQLSALAISYSMSVLGAVMLLVAGWFIAGTAERSVHAALGRIPGFDQTLRRFFAMVVRYAVLVLVVIMVLGQFGVQTASIIAALGAIGLAVGLALQGTLQNIAAGIMLLVLRPLRIGESVEVGAVAGTVEEIGLFATQLRTADGVYLLAPNSTLWNQPVRNYSRNRTRKAEITIGIKPGEDIDAARPARSRAGGGACRTRRRRRGETGAPLLDVAGRFRQGEGGSVAQAARRCRGAAGKRGVVFCSRAAWSRPLRPCRARPCRGRGWPLPPAARWRPSCAGARWCGSPWCRSLFPGTRFCRLVIGEQARL